MQVFARMPPTDIGCTAMQAGPGFQIIPGDGPLSIMAAGFMKMVMAGCGCRVTNGRRPGLAGEEVPMCTDGRRFRPISMSVLHTITIIHQIIITHLPVTGALYHTSM